MGVSSIAMEISVEGLNTQIELAGSSSGYTPESI